MSEDPNIRLAQLRDRIGSSDIDAAKVGAKLAEVLALRRDRDNRSRWHTAWGSKTDAGLARTVLRILDEAAEG